MQNRSSRKRNNSIEKSVFKNLSVDQLLVRKHLHTWSLVLLAFTAVGFLLIQLRTVLIPFVLAMLLTYALTPIIDFLTRPPPSRPARDGGGGGHQLLQTSSDDETEGSGALLPTQSTLCARCRPCPLRMVRLPLILASLLALLIASLFLAAIGAIIATSVVELTKNADKYSPRITMVANWIVSVSSWLGLSTSIETLREKFFMPLSQFMLDTLGVVINELQDTFLMILFFVYLLFGYRPHKKVGGVRREIDAQIKRYIGLKVLISLATGIFVGFSLTLLRVDLSFVFGLLAFLLNFIPNVGSLVATLLPLPVVFLDETKTWFEVALVFFLPGSVQFLIGNVVEPRVFGKNMDLHPVTVLLSLMLWGAMWGPVGMVLSVPISAIIKICFQRLDHPVPKFIANLMEGRFEDNDDRSLDHELEPMTPVHSEHSAEEIV